MTLKMKLAVFAALLLILPSQAFAGSCIGKTVDVWVINGHDLTGDGMQNPDPYVIVNIGKDTKRTRIVYSDADPVWYQRLRFHDVTSDVMRIEIWEADGGIRGDDDHLGTCVEQLESGGSQYRQVECRARDSGYVKLFYKCH